MGEELIISQGLGGTADSGEADHLANHLPENDFFKYLRNFRFDPQTFGGVILLIESKLAPLNGSCAQDAAGIGVADQCRHSLGGAWWWRALAQRRCAPTGAEQRHEDSANRGALDGHDTPLKPLSRHCPQIGKIQSIGGVCPKG